MKTESRASGGARHELRAPPAQVPAGFVRHKTRPHMYVFVLGVWLLSLAWFGPRLWALLEVGTTPFEKAALGFFVVFMQVAWLFAIFNIGVVVFATVFRKKHARRYASTGVLPKTAPAVALLYTTCNDFVEESAESCLDQDYPDYTVYICDDSSIPAFREKVDAFAAKYPAKVKVLRRGDRKGFKAGNMNHALAEHAIDEPFFAIADADEILPPDFLRRVIPILLEDEACGFVQANHRSNPSDSSPLAKSLGIGIDIHWRWYHPLRNEYGFVMLLGHGVVIRRSCWEQAGGFPELVSEDLALALKLREMGYHGRFAEDIICYESFPADMRAFRVRHMKWTRGTCEFLHRLLIPSLFSRKLPWHEKLDILLPTINLPLTLFYFLFVIDANLVLTAMFGQQQAVTLVGGANELVVQTKQVSGHFEALIGMDFYAITILTLVAPMICFIIELYRQPGRLIPFLSRSTTVYGALSPLSCVGIIGYLITRKAVFHVTADTVQDSVRSGIESFSPSPTPLPAHTPSRRGAAWLRNLLTGTHPDHKVVQGIELGTGIAFGILCILNLQLAFLGLCIAFVLHPTLHHVRWQHPAMRVLVHVPFAFILVGLALGAMSMLGMQTVFFGYGFHF
ncbi:MAG: glycosyltransferase [Fimbriimonadaceae bacterium]